MLYCETLAEIKVLAQVSALRDTRDLHETLAPLPWSLIQSDLHQLLPSHHLPVPLLYYLLAPTKPHLVFIHLFSFTTTPMPCQPSEYSVSCVHLHGVQKYTHKHQLLKQVHFNQCPFSIAFQHALSSSPRCEASPVFMWMHSHIRMHT